MSDKNHPFDDYGFKNDQIVDCIEKIIDNVWSSLHENQSKKIDTKELLEMTAILNNSWSLVESMINFHEELYEDEILSTTLEEEEDDEKDEDEDGDEDEDEEEDEDEDEEDDDDDDDDEDGKIKK